MCRKSDVLDAGGYHFDYWHCTYVNWQKKALFTHLYVDAHTAEQLETVINRIVPGAQWQFFSSKPVSEYVMEKVRARYC